jgi:predicted MFS family arabinose efflux permease
VSSEWRLTLTIKKQSDRASKEQDATPLKYEPARLRGQNMRKSEAIMSVFQIAGQLTFGYLSDKQLLINTLIVVLSSVAAIATLSMWSLARLLLPLIFFALLYGFFGAEYTAMWARIVTAISREPSASQAMFSLFCFGKGIGNVLTGPISAVLLRGTTENEGYGKGIYLKVVIFPGACLLSSAGSLSTTYC